MKFGIGQPVRRKRIRFVTGQGRYLDDIQIHHAAFAHFCSQSSRPCGHSRHRRHGCPSLVGCHRCPDRSRYFRDGVCARTRCVQEPRWLCHAPIAQDAPARDALRRRGGGDGRRRDTGARQRCGGTRQRGDYEPLRSASTLETAPPVWDDAPGNLVLDWADGDESACAAASPPRRAPSR